jgi:hypothetical protein
MRIVIGSILSWGSGDSTGWLICSTELRVSPAAMIDGRVVWIVKQFTRICENFRVMMILVFSLKGAPVENCLGEAKCVVEDCRKFVVHAMCV